MVSHSRAATCPQKSGTPTWRRSPKAKPAQNSPLPPNPPRQSKSHPAALEADPKQPPHARANRRPLRRPQKHLRPLSGEPAEPNHRNIDGSAQRALVVWRCTLQHRDARDACGDPDRMRLVAKEDKVEFEGEVIEALPNAMFRVKLDNDHVVLGHVAGKMRRFRIRILPGDRVRCELSPYDLDRARIVYRHR